MICSCISNVNKINEPLSSCCILQVCLQIKTVRLPENSSRSLTSFAGANARRRISFDRSVPTVVHQKPGPMQTIFELPPDEVGISHS
jgi:hypothetical protein